MRDLFRRLAERTAMPLGSLGHSCSRCSQSPYGA